MCSEGTYFDARHCTSTNLAYLISINPLYNNLGTVAHKVCIFFSRIKFSLLVECPEIEQNKPSDVYSMYLYAITVNFDLFILTIIFL